MPNVAIRLPPIKVRVAHAKSPTRRDAPLRIQSLRIRRALHNLPGKCASAKGEIPRDCCNSTGRPRYHRYRLYALGMTQNQRALSFRARIERQLCVVRIVSRCAHREESRQLHEQPIGGGYAKVSRAARLSRSLDQPERPVAVILSRRRRISAKRLVQPNPISSLHAFVSGPRRSSANRA
jgi:uncharacterized DUF497 family protein